MSSVCVVIPIFKPNLTPLEKISFEQTLKILAAHDFYIVAPEGLFFNPLLARAIENKIRVLYFKKSFFQSITSYNQLLMSKEFYEKFKQYHALLIAQLDSFVFRDELEYWAEQNYGTIGAPWFRGFDSPDVTTPEITGVGNGGFCMRNVDQCLRVLTAKRRLNTFSKLLQSDRPLFQNLISAIRDSLLINFGVPSFARRINEDRFWAIVIPRYCSFFQIPSVDEAVRFSFEAMPHYLYERNNYQLPFGCHGWWKYNPSFWRPHIESEGYSLEKLI
jgi:hypothetical protein